jgi:hypothetical protein
MSSKFTNVGNRADVRSKTMFFMDGSIASKRNFAMPVASALRPEQIDAMNVAFSRACATMRLTGPTTPVIEIVAIRIIELARAGEFDPDKLVATVAAEFDMQWAAKRSP